MRASWCHIWPKTKERKREKSLIYKDFSGFPGSDYAFESTLKSVKKNTPPDGGVFFLASPAAIMRSNHHTSVNKRNNPSRGRVISFGLPGAIRTRDLSLRRRTLYPAELRRDYVFYCRHTVTSGKSLGAKSGAKSAKCGVSGGRQLRKPRQFRPFFTRLSGETVTLGGERSILLSYGETAFS